ncbi:hypothetical protein D3C80_2024980 [compost metagenome]
MKLRQYADIVQLWISDDLIDQLLVSLQKVGGMLLNIHSSDVWIADLQEKRNVRIAGMHLFRVGQIRLVKDDDLQALAVRMIPVCQP